MNAEKKEERSTYSKKGGGEKEGEKTSRKRYRNYKNSDEGNIQKKVDEDKVKV